MPAEQPLDGDVPVAGAPGDPDQATTTEVPAAPERERAAQALRAAFTRLAPQGSDAWNFSAAFTHLGDRYGPYHPGASALSDARRDPAAPQDRGGRWGRLRPRRAGVGDARDESELEVAMGHVVEAFRFLSARVSTLEARLAAEDRPVEGAAWLVPARELDGLVEPLVAHLLARSPGGPVVHADCGEGVFVRALARRGVTAQGVEPRGAVALRAIERGSDVTIGEVSERLGTAEAGSLGGVVLSGVVDRSPLHALLPLLTQCRRTMALGAPLVVVSEPPAAADQREAPACDVAARPLHRETWELVLERSGFVEVAPVAGTPATDGRLVLSAAVPA
jgi:hypothetical protein